MTISHEGSTTGLGFPTLGYPYHGWHGPTQPNSPRSTPGEGRRARIAGVLLRVLGVLLLAALGGSARGQAADDGLPSVTNRLVLSWRSLGPGTQYSVETSTDLLTWVAATNTTATNLSLVFTGEASRTLRLSATNAPPQATTVTWNANAPADDVAGYFIHYRAATGGYTNHLDAGLATRGMVSNLVAGATYYFAVTAYSPTGLESGYSAEAAWQCPLRLGIQPLP